MHYDGEFFRLFTRSEYPDGRNFFLIKNKLRRVRDSFPIKYQLHTDNILL